MKSKDNFEIVYCLAIIMFLNVLNDLYVGNKQWTRLCEVHLCFPWGICKKPRIVFSNLGNNSNTKRNQPGKGTSKTVEQVFSVEIPRVDEVFDEVALKGNGVIDEGVERTSFNNQLNANQGPMQSNSFIPNVWVKTYNSTGLPNKTNSYEPYRSQFKRTTNMFLHSFIHA